MAGTAALLIFILTFNIVWSAPQQDIYRLYKIGRYNIPFTGTVGNGLIGSGIGNFGAYSGLLGNYGLGLGQYGGLGVGGYNSLHANGLGGYGNLNGGLGGYGNLNGGLGGYGNLHGGLGGYGNLNGGLGGYGNLYGGLGGYNSLYGGLGGLGSLNGGLGGLGSLYGQGLGAYNTQLLGSLGGLDNYNGLNAYGGLYNTYGGLNSLLGGYNSLTGLNPYSRLGVSSLDDYNSLGNVAALRSLYRLGRVGDLSNYSTIGGTLNSLSLVRNLGAANSLLNNYSGVRTISRNLEDDRS